LNDTVILDSVSLYFLTQTFLSAEWIYSRGSFRKDYNVERPAAPMGYSAFRYNIAQWPRAIIEKVGNLTIYQGRRCHLAVPSRSATHLLQSTLVEATSPALTIPLRWCLI
jgi:hypothetical protein